MELPEWDLTERQNLEVASPIELPTLCEIPSSGVWPVECWKALDAYDFVANKNVEIAAKNADAFRTSEESYDRLLQAAKTQQQLGVIRQEMLDRERREHTLDNWFHRGVIVLGAIVAVTL